MNHTPSGLRSLDIRAELLRRGCSATKLALQLGIAPTMVVGVIQRKRKTPYIRRTIAESIGMPYEMVWGVADPEIDRIRPRVRLPGTGGDGARSEHDVRHSASGSRPASG